MPSTASVFSVTALSVVLLSVVSVAVSYTHLDVYKRQVFMKEDLVPIIGDENMIQEMPEEFNKVLEVQRSWQK